MDYLTKQAVKLLQKHEPAAGYFGCFSGGKDSTAVKALAEMAGVRVEWHYHKTTIDPPELVKFIRAEHPDVIWDRPKHGNFFNRMVKKGLPNRHVRWCCNEYKEVTYPSGAVVIMGIRAEESPKRAKNWGLVTEYKKTGNTIINPIFEWASDELWDFIHDNEIPYCSLYDEGFKRLGCVGCPMVDKRVRLREFERWPKLEEKWKRATRLLWESRSGITQRDGREWFGNAFFNNWQEMWNWWLYDQPLPNKKQLKLDI